jgi:hypothetical protein
MFFLLLPPQPLFPKDPSLNERSKTLDAPRKQKKKKKKKKEAVTLVVRKKHETSCVLHLLSQLLQPQLLYTLCSSSLTYNNE